MHVYKMHLSNIKEYLPNAEFLKNKNTEGNNWTLSSKAELKILSNTFQIWVD